ncbi:pilus assembly PilX family protein [Comamonas suwonensis]|uniref:pilus assembly PilX family protein n=1 Tax=Comamonas suwonensis TaxID=2606214 RepID=UPI00145EDA05|nr:hypothetical protein [Comamonas suwonensis]MBI1624232.1 hypothetical protein [Comamonas suwonensis]
MSRPLLNWPPIAVRASFRQSRSQQRGFSLFFSLIALVILLVAAVSVMQSSGLSLSTSGNSAFQQDILARADAANVKIFSLLRSGGALSTEANLANSSKSSNYSALALETNDQGIPLALISETQFDGVGESSNDIKDEASNTVIRYVIERLCDQSGESGALGREHCIHEPDPNPILGGSSTQMGSDIRPGFAPIYRVSVRIQGPRGSEAYLQNTFTKPN